MSIIHSYVHTVNYPKKTGFFKEQNAGFIAQIYRVTQNKWQKPGSKNQTCYVHMKMYSILNPVEITQTHPLCKLGEQKNLFTGDVFIRPPPPSIKRKEKKFTKIVCCECCMSELFRTFLLKKYIYILLYKSVMGESVGPSPIKNIIE